MKKDNTVFLQKRCAGMTILEVVVFVSLALFVLGTSFPLLSRLMASDRAHEERLAAYTFLQKSGQQLGVIPYKSLTNGFSRTGNTDKYRYKMEFLETNFYKNISGRYQILLVQMDNGQIGDYYKADLELKWTTKIGGLSEQEHVSTVFLTFLPDI